MNKSKDILKKAKRIVIKIGTALLTDNDIVSESKISIFVKDIAGIIKGREVVLVTSGAVSSGIGILGAQKKMTMPLKQAYASVGQVRLMSMYDKCFRKYGLNIGQILLTDFDYNNRKAYLNIRNTFEALLKNNIVPVINENDSVAIDELTSVGDNDTLSAMVAIICEADLLILLSNIDGLYDLGRNHMIEEIKRVDSRIRELAKNTSNPRSTGGMVTKLNAAEMVTKAGIPMIIGNGTKAGALLNILSGSCPCSFFYPDNKSINKRKSWIF